MKGASAETSRVYYMTDSDSPYGRPETSIPRAATSVQMRYFTSPLYTDNNRSYSRTSD